MHKLSSFLMASLICLGSLGQRKTTFEISVAGRYDRHAKYVSNFAGRIYNDTNRLYGFSYGVNGILRRQLAKKYFVYIGVGYYQLRVDKIKGSMPFNAPGTRTGRNIDYEDDSTNLAYSTSRYHYNDIAISFGLGKQFQVKNNFKLDIAAEMIGYKTFSQKYSLMRNSNYYTTENNKPLELGININAGVIKEYRQFYLGSSLVIPIYQNLKGDKVFYEDPRMNISKWLNGVGLSLRIGKYL